MPRESAGFSVRIFIPSGGPEGLRIVEKSNWTGQGVIFPRSLMSEARRRPELARTGIYVLWGPGESGQLPRVYVGEGEGVMSRLDQHARSKDFWTHAAVFTSKDQNLNKAHVQHLEARLVALASEAKRCELDNGNVPQLPALSEADKADAESFLADVLLCLPVVGVNVFERSTARASKGRDLYLRAKGIEARGVDSPEGFVVRAGSSAVKKNVPSIPDNVASLRRTLVERGVLVDAGDVFRLPENYTFSSPSLAAAVFLARSANGRTTWKDSSGRTLKEIQEAEASSN